MNNKTNIKVPIKYIDRVEKIIKAEDGYWIYFNRGHDTNDKMKLHQDKFLSQKDILKCIRESVSCNCEYCLGLIQPINLDFHV